MATEKKATPAKSAVKKTAAKTAARSAAKKTAAKGAAAEPAKKHEPTHREIAELAHTYSQKRGHHHGNHVEDWLRAERELRGK